MSSVKTLIPDLKKAAREKNRARRAASIAAVITEALRSIGQEPIVVGGAAVEIYTQGGYSTKDIDMVSEGGAELRKVMEKLGFVKRGKDFLNVKLKIYIEFPSYSLKQGEKSVPLKIGNYILRIISVDDLIVDRLNAYKFWKSAIDGINALLLLELGESDETRLRQRAKEEDVADALKAVERVREESIRKKLSKKAANRLIEEKMRQLR